MEIKELHKLLPFNINTTEIDPARVVEHHFFNNNSTRDYREESIKFLNKNRISFNTTTNTVHTFPTQFVQVKCPTCKKVLKASGGGGSTNIHHIHFTCKPCKLTVSITTPDDGYSVNFDE